MPYQHQPPKELKVLGGLLGRLETKHESHKWSVINIKTNAGHNRLRRTSVVDNTLCMLSHIMAGRTQHHP